MTSLFDPNFITEFQSLPFSISLLLIAAIGTALLFEFANGFHDTANAVATVIYTKSLRPMPAVLWSGFCNFVGVLIGGTVVAGAVVALLPADVVTGNNPVAAAAAVLALLLSAVLWNISTWYFGIPASSSHTVVGSMLGVGAAYAIGHGKPWTSGVNWSKAADVGLALLVSPLFGFAFAAGLFLLIRKRTPKELKYHKDAPPPWPIRILMIFTSTGVSLAHGSNDGQKGVGLIMLILIVLMPGYFAIRPEALKITTETRQEFANIQSDLMKSIDNLPASEKLRISSLALPKAVASDIASPAAVVSKTVSEKSNDASAKSLLAPLLEKSQHLFNAIDALNDQTPSPEAAVKKQQLRRDLILLQDSIKKMEKQDLAVVRTSRWSDFKRHVDKMAATTKVVPIAVLMMVALALGLGTTIGWKRIVVTLGEKLGKQHMTYSQGAAAEVVAMSTIGVSSMLGVPVSTTHVLSSGIAGTMVAGRSGLERSTVTKILWAWVLTLPATFALAWGLYFVLENLFAIWIVPGIL